MADGLEKIKADIADLTERIRQHRIERGLSPDPPKHKRKLSDELTLTLMDRLDSFVEVCLEIARLYRAGHFIVIDPKRLKQYRTCASLLGRSRGFDAWITGYKVGFIIALIKDINTQISEGSTVEELNQYRNVGRFYEAVMKLRTELPHSKGAYRYFMKRSYAHEEF
ncbi:hypothetical protein GCM10023310_54260 [Paenibacillus vulneris]|uniref:Uncharacterized protein n=1 Tax=Paenibacillus vulneris TaxID=1133364 RepID=A0ABW3UD94_9BACL